MKGERLRWLCLDLLGVTFGILGCYVTGIHYAFHCYATTHNTYMAVFLALALVSRLDLRCQIKLKSGETRRRR